MQRDNWGKWAMIIALLLIVAAGYFVITTLNKRQIPITIGGQVVTARIADNDDTRRKGLSGTEPLGERDAMLFVFDTPGRWQMWMREMSYSLDILWLSADKKIVYIAEDVSPDTYPKVFFPDSDALYVIELPAGYVNKHNVQLGQSVGFTVR